MDDDTFFTDDEDGDKKSSDGDDVFRRAAPKKKSTKTADDRAAPASVDDRFRGGVLGLLMLEDLPTGKDADRATERGLRLAQQSFVAAALDVVSSSHDDAVRPIRLPPVLRIACYEAPKKLYSDPRELASAAIDAAAVASGCAAAALVESLPDHLLRLQDAKRKFGRNVADAAIRRQLWDMDARFGNDEEASEASEASQGWWTPCDVRGAEAISACCLEGSLALDAATPPSTAIFRRLLGPSRVYAGDSVRIRTDRHVLIDRVAWVRAMRSAVLPKFVTPKQGGASAAVGSRVATVGGPTLKVPSVAESAKALAGTGEGILSNLRAALMACGVHDERTLMSDGDLISDVVRDVQAATAAVAASAKNEEDASDAPDADVAYSTVIADIEAFVAATLSRGPGGDAQASRGGAAPRGKRRGAAPSAPSAPDARAAACELSTLPGGSDRTFDDWLRCDSGTDATATAAQGHLSTAGPVLLAAGDDVLPRVLVYDHMRSVDPSSACLTATADRIRESGERVRDETDAAMTAAGAKRTGGAVFEDVRTELRAYAVVYDRIHRPPVVPLGGFTEAEAASIAAESAAIEANDELDYDGLLALGISDASHYSRLEPRAPAFAPKDRPDDFLALRGARTFSARDMLTELSASLGLSPPLGVAEERAVLDGLEYHMPSGEGEQARQLRRRIAEIRRRRIELMAKADSSGKQYDAVERKLMDRLRAEAAPKILSEVVVNLCAVLSAVVLSASPERVAAASGTSSALAACVASLRRGGAKNRKSAVDVDVNDLLACAAAGMLSGRLPPPTPTEVDLGPQIEAAERAVRAELPSGTPDLAVVAVVGTAADRGGADGTWPRDFRPLRSQRQPGRRSRASGSRQTTSTRLLSVLWDHVRAEHGARLRVQNSVVGVRSATACCAFAVSEPGREEEDASKGDDADAGTTGELTRWSALAGVSADIKRVLDEHADDRRGADERESQGVLAGIPMAGSVEPEILRDVAAAHVPAVEITQAHVFPFEPQPPPRPDEGTAEDGDDPGAMRLLLEKLRAEDPLLEAELVPPSSAQGAFAALQSETARRYEALVGALGVDGDAAADLYALLMHVRTDAGGPDEKNDNDWRIAAGFMRAELGPSLSRLATGARMTPALAADRDMSQVSSIISMSSTASPEATVALRARFRDLATACASAASTAPQLSAHVSVFAMWALSRAGEPSSVTEPRLEEASVRAASILFSRLVERATFNRSDRGAEEQVALQQKMEDARARVRAANDNLSDEQRELLREHRKIKRVDDAESAVGAPAALGSDAAKDDDGGRDNDGGPQVVDAIDMYATD